MKFKITKQLLEERISDVFSVTSSNNTIITPIFKAVLFEVFNNEIIIKASNSSTSINTKIIAEGKSLEVESTGSFLTPIKKLYELIKKTNANVLFFEKTEESILTISTNKSRYSLQLFDTKTYPKIDFEIKGKVFNIEKNILDDISNKITFSADNEHKQSRKEFSGINLISQNEKLNIVATNMHRLSKISIDTQETEINTILPISFFKLINKINATKNSQPKIWISDEKTQIQTNNTIIQFQNIVGNYPDVSKVIPSEFTTSLIVDKEEIEKALDRIEMFTNEENKIKLSATNEKLFVNSTNQTTGVSVEKIEKFNKQGEDIEILISSKYMLDAIKTINNKEIKIKFNSNTKPILIEDMNDQKITHIVLPYRANS